METKFILSAIALFLSISEILADGAVYPKLDMSRLDKNVSPWRESKTEKTNWEKRPFYILQSDLSPAWLVQCAEKEIAFFYDLPKWGLGLPTHMACKTADGKSKILSGEGMKISGAEMTAPWILCWFSGAEGWKDFDVPWLLVLQNRPQSVEMTKDGLKICFPKEAGQIGSMPFYGQWKCPLEKSPFANYKGRLDMGIRTWEWKNALPENAVKRADCWSSQIRKYPIYAEEKFSLREDDLIVKTEFQYIESDDAWGTKKLDFAPIPHVLGLAIQSGWKALSVKEKIHDPFMVTAWGPLLAVEGKSHEISFKGLLKYVHEKEAASPPETELGKDALGRLRSWYDNRLKHGDQYWPPWGIENLVWSTAGADFIVPKLSGHVSPEMKAKAVKMFDPWMQNYILQDSFTHDGKTINFWLSRQEGNKEYYNVNGPGIGGDIYGDGGKLATNTLYTFWCYGHYFDRWDFLKSKWGKIGKTMLTPLNMDWKSQGRYAIAEMGDEAQPAMAYARMAYRLGDADAYAYGSYIFAKELLHHYVKSMGGDYFKKYQPINHLQESPNPLYLTNLLGSTVGWSSGGPDFGSVQWTNRFVRFNDEDIGRFHNEHLKDFHRDELDNMEKLRAPTKGKTGGHGQSYDNVHDRSHINPCIPRLRSFILGESAEELAKFAKPSDIKEDSGTPLAMFAYVRASAPKKYEKLIDSKGVSTDFVLGKERDAGYFSPFTVQFGRFTKFWPVVAWHCAPSWAIKEEGGFPNPKDYLNYGTGTDRSFGAIKPGSGLWPINGAVDRLNWNTQVMSWELTDKAPVNLAAKSRGAEAKVSDMENDYYQPFRLIDGDFGSKWASKRQGNGDVPEEKWIEVIFPGEESIGTIAIHGGGEIRKIEISSDGKSYAEVKTRPIEQMSEIRLENPVKAKYIRVIFKPTRYMEIKELEVFAL